MANVINIKEKDGFILSLSRSELFCLEKLLGLLSSEKTQELGLSEEEDNQIYKLYISLPDSKEYICT